MAQSSVTLFGTVDVGVQNASQGGVSKTQMSHSGTSSSALGFKGTEDLGSGMSASFHFEGTVAVQNGNAAGLAFTRRSTLDLAGAFGAVRLGRDYTPTFWNHTVYDPFGTVGSGAGSDTSLGWNASGANALTAARTNNGVSYLYNFANNSGSAVGNQGVTVQLTYALPGNLSTGIANGKYTGGRVGYNAGPLTLAAAYSESNAGTAAQLGSNFSATVGGVTFAGITPATNVTYKETNIAGSYDLGVANLMGKWGTNDSSVANTKQTFWSIGAKVPAGPGYIPVSFNSVSQNNTAKTGADKFAIGYVYNLSPRTALYGTYAKIDNKNNGQYTFMGGNGGFTPALNGGAAAPTPGADGTAYDFGIRHNF
jgi:predicted porin